MSFSNDFGAYMIENLAVDRAREFLRPKSPTEQLQYIVMILWFLLAFFASMVLQFYIFIILVFLILINTFRSFLIKDVEVRPLAGAILRLGIFFWLYIIFGPAKIITPFELNGQVVLEDIFLTQKVTLGVLFIFGLITRNLHLKLLVSGNIDDYFDFVGAVLTAIAQIALVILVFYSWDFFPFNSVFNQTPSELQGFSILEVILIIGIASYILSSLSPGGESFKRLQRAKSLILIQSSRLERFRFTALVTGLLIMVLDFLRIFSDLGPLVEVEVNNVTVLIPDPEYVTALPNFQTFIDFGVFMLVIGLLLFIFGTGTRRTGADFWESLKQGQMPSADLIKNSMPKSINDAKESVKDKIIKENTQQFYKLSKDMPVINKGKGSNSFTMKKDAVAVPVSETEEGVAVVFVGESEIKDKEKVAVDSGATTLLIPHPQWQDIYNNLEAIKPSDELIQSLALKGVETKEKLLSIANQALDNFKNWQGPKALVTEANIQAFLQSVQSGKYGVIEEAGYSRVKFPGVTVIESPEIQYVNVLGIVKVLEIPTLGLQSVDVPFVKVMESKDYEFVQGPGFNVLDTPEGQIVNVFGMNFSEGDKQLIASRIGQIAEDRESLNRLMAGPLEEILEDPNKTLALTQSLSGEQKLLMAGKDEAFIEDASSSLKTREQYKHDREHAKRQTKRDRKSKKRQEKRRMKGKPVTISIDTSIGGKKDMKLISDQQTKELPTKSEASKKPVTKKLVIRDSSDVPVCGMCNKEVTTGGTRCPHCKEYFHKSHYLTWVRDTGECYSCKNPITLEFE